jgi:hypothetical protein
VQGIDFGWANPTAGIYCAIDFTGRWYVVGEHYQSEKPISVHAREMRTLEVANGIVPSARFLDPSAWARRSEYEAPAAEFADYGIDCGRAQNDRLGGWNRIEEMLSRDMEDGMPQLQIFSSCRNLIRELPNLRIKAGTDDVDKVNDHASDALRYAIMTRMPHPEEDDEPETFEERSLRRMMERRSQRELLRLG